jgi:hypothetical protein
MVLSRVFLKNGNKSIEIPKFDDNKLLSNRMIVLGLSARVFERPVASNLSKMINKIAQLRQLITSRLNSIINTQPTILAKSTFRATHKKLNNYSKY